MMLLWFDVDAVAFAQLVGDRLAQFGNSRRRRIAGFVFTERGRGGSFDVIGSRTKRFATFELIDRSALGPQLHDAIANLHDVGKADFVETLGQMKPSGRCEHCWRWNLRMKPKRLMNARL